MSQILNPSGGGGGGSGIQTINGDTGSITGSTVTIYANNSAVQAGSSVKFVNSGTISTFEVTDSSSNTLIGLGAGNLTLSGNDNVGVGISSLESLTSGLINTAIGSDSLADVTTGQGNCAIGNLAGGHITTGSFNILAGVQAGQNYVSSESSNICVSNSGVASESNTIRLGTNGGGAGAQNRCFVAGINGNTVSNPALVTINTSTGQLGTTPIATTLFSVVMNTSQSLAQNALDNIVYDTVLVDTASAYSGGTYTIPTTGNWEFNIAAVFKSTVSFINCDIFLVKNGATFLLHGQPCVSVSDPSAVTVNTGGIFPLTSGDTIKMSVFAQTTGGTNYDVSGFANGYYNTFIGILMT